MGGAWTSEPRNVSTNPVFFLNHKYQLHGDAKGKVTLGLLMPVKNVISIHPFVLQIFQILDQPTNWHCHLLRHVTNVDTNMHVSSCPFLEFVYKVGESIYIYVQTLRKG